MGAILAEVVGSKPRMGSESCCRRLGAEDLEKKKSLVNIFLIGCLLIKPSNSLIINLLIYFRISPYHPPLPSLNQSCCIFIYLSILYVNVFICLSTFCMFLCSSIRIHICLLVCLSMHIFVYLLLAFSSIRPCVRVWKHIQSMKHARS
jgi:hypothetical protein